MVIDEVIVLCDNVEVICVEMVSMLLYKFVGMLADVLCVLVILDMCSEFDVIGVILLQCYFYVLQLVMLLVDEDSGLVVVSQDGWVVLYFKDCGVMLEQEYLVEVIGELVFYGMKCLVYGLSFCNWLLLLCKVSWQNEICLCFVIKLVYFGQLCDMCCQVGLEVVSVCCLCIGCVVMGKFVFGQWCYFVFDECF